VLAPDWSRGRTISSSACADTTDFHGALQRLLDGSAFSSNSRKAVP
jgi:hypothetical protein